MHFSGGLAAPLRELAAEVGRIDGLRCDFRYRCKLTPEPVLAAHLYRIAQEAVHNAIKHARASRITIDCSSSGRSLRLQVSDDGRGLPARLDGLSGMGIETMHHRAGVIGATLLIEPGHGGGTNVVCRCRL